MYGQLFANSILIKQSWVRSLLAHQVLKSCNQYQKMQVYPTMTALKTSKPEGKSYKKLKTIRLEHTLQPVNVVVSGPLWRLPCENRGGI